MMVDEARPMPTFDPGLFTMLQELLERSGPLAAVDELCRALKAAEDLQAYFYAKLMRKRIELGVSPFPSGPASDLPPETHEAYEEAIREAGREVGQSYLQRGDIGKAWIFYRLIEEPEPVRQAIANFQPKDNDDPYPVIEVAWQHGVLPEKGFDLVLERNGVCSAITMVHSSDLSSNPGLRHYCIGRLVTALSQQLRERLRSELQSRGQHPKVEATVGELLAMAPDLVSEDIYHVDISHLSSVVQMAMHLTPGPELDLARDLCLYGSRLSVSLKGEQDPPFENTYDDYKVYLDILAGVDVESGLAHFRAKLPAAAEEGNSYPAEVLVNLLVKLQRLPEALAVAREHLLSVDERQLSCPGVYELARRLGDFAILAEVSKSRADPVNFLAGLIAARRGT